MYIFSLLKINKTPSYYIIIKTTLPDTDILNATTTINNITILIHVI